MKYYYYLVRLNQKKMKKNLRNEKKKPTVQYITDFVKKVKVIENDVEDVNNICNEIQFSDVYDTTKAVIKMIVDIFKCFKPKIFN